MRSEGGSREVSVVIPTRDRRALLACTLASVLAQRDVDLQVVVVDDGSTDGTAEWVRRLDDGRVLLLRNERSTGVSIARNRGVDAAAGEWVAFCDDDDLWAPDKLRRQLDAAHRQARTWAYGSSVTVDHRLRVLWRQGAPPAGRAVGQLAWRNVVPGGCSNVVARRDLLARVGGFDPRLRVLADWDLWIRLAQAGPPAVVPAAVVAYRVHTANMSMDTRGLFDEFRAIERRTTALRDGQPLDWTWLHRWTAATHLRGRRRRAAAAAYARALRCGDLPSGGRLLLALLAMGPANRLLARRHAPDPDVVAEVAGWLPALGGAPVPVGAAAA